MSLINWIFDIYQHTQIDKARTEASQARSELSALRSSGGGVDAARLQTALEELALAVKTVQRMLLEKGVCTSEEFAATLRRIDLEDGAADGRARLR
jgi:hypothetical protein